MGGGGFAVVVGDPCGVDRALSSAAGLLAAVPVAALAGLLGEWDALADLAEEVVDVVGHLGEGDGGVAAGDGVGGGAEKPGGLAGGSAVVTLDVVHVSIADEGIAAEGAAEAEAFLFKGEGAEEHEGGDGSAKEAEGELVRVYGGNVVVQQQRDVEGEGVEEKRAQKRRKTRVPGRRE